MVKGILETIESMQCENKTAIYEVSTSKSMTYNSLIKIISGIIVELKNSGINEGDHVILVGDNSIDFISTYIALTEIKVALIPISSNISEHELEKVIYECDANKVINTSSVEFTVLYNYCKVPIGIINGDLFVINNINVNRMAEALIFMRTSGSTNQPKVVMHSIKGLIGNALAHGDGVGYDFKERSLVLLPINFSFAHTSQILAILLFGGTLYLVESGNVFTPRNFNKIVNKFSITSTCLLSIHLLRWSKHASSLVIKPESLKHVCYAGGPTPFSIVTYLRECYPKIDFLQAYGLTEAGPRVSVVKPNDSFVDKNHVGQSVDRVELQVRNSDTNTKFSANNIGEIYVKSPYIMKGYYKNPQLTNSVIRNGWLATGDLGYLNEKGYLFIVGRSKNLIITMGHNVYPEEVEEYLMEHGAILDAYVYGVKDKDAGEIIAADVVINKALLDEKSIIDYCRQGLTNYKIPRLISITKSIKRNKRGKIIRYKE